MQPAYRCLVPATAFCEYAPGKPALPYWFALAEDRGRRSCLPAVAALDGHARHQGRAGRGEHFRFAFLTCEPNQVVAPSHPNSMPVILTTPEECDA